MNKLLLIILAVICSLCAKEPIKITIPEDLYSCVVERISIDEYVIATSRNIYLYSIGKGDILKFAAANDGYTFKDIFQDGSTVKAISYNIKTKIINVYDIDTTDYVSDLLDIYIPKRFHEFRFIDQSTILLVTSKFELATINIDKPEKHMEIKSDHCSFWTSRLDKKLFGIDFCNNRIISFSSNGVKENSFAKKFDKNITCYNPAYLDGHFFIQSDSLQVFDVNNDEAKRIIPIEGELLLIGTVNRNLIFKYRYTNIKKTDLILFDIDSLPRVINYKTVK